MAGTVNKVILIGHLGDEVKMHYFEGGNSIGRFPIATNESYTDKEGNKVDNTDWHNIVVRNKLAEVCEKYLKKGDKIYLEGKLKTRSWEQDGEKRYTTEIHVREMTMLSTKGSSSQNGGAATEPAPTPDVSTSTEADDLPF